MTNSLLPPGFKDEVSDLAGIEHKYKNKIINLFQINAYKLVKSPLVEYSNNLNSSNALKIKVKKNNQNFMIIETDDFDIFNDNQKLQDIFFKIEKYLTK